MMDPSDRDMFGKSLHVRSKINASITVGGNSPIWLVQFPPILGLATTSAFTIKLKVTLE